MMRKVFTQNDDWLDVTDKGEVYHHGKRLKEQKYPKSGYLYVQNQGNNYLIHRLVISGFVQPLKRGDRSLQVHHKNGDKADNRLENLELLTVQEHQHHHKQIYPTTKKCEVCGKEYTPHKTKRKRAKTCSKECWLKTCQINAKKRKKPIAQFDVNGTLIKTWDSSQGIMRELGYFGSNIAKCCKGEINTYKGFVWKYADHMTDTERYSIIKPGG